MIDVVPDQLPTSTRISEAGYPSPAYNHPRKPIRDEKSCHFEAHAIEQAP